MLNSIQRIIRNIFRDTFGITKFEDVSSHHSAPTSVVKGFFRRENGGPDVDRLQIDMYGEIDSRWNQRVTRMLFDKVAANTEAVNMDLPRTVWEKGIKDRLRRMKDIWKMTQPRRHPKTGLVETPDELDHRVSESVAEEGARRRRDTRRSTVSYQALSSICASDFLIYRRTTLA